MNARWAAMLLLAALAPACGSDVGAAARLGEYADTPIRSMQLLTATEGWVLTGRALLRTSDGGMEWVAITPPQLRASKLRGAFFRDGEHGWAVASGRPDAAEAMPLLTFRTEDGGASWVSSVLAPPSLFYTESAGGPAYISFADEQHGWVVVKLRSSSNFSTGHLFRTSDGGVTWARLSIPIGDPIRFISSSTGWVAGGTGGDELYVSRDGGGTWQSQQVPPPRGFTSGQPVYHLPTFEGELGVLPVTFAGARSGVGFYTSRDEGRSWTLETSLILPYSIPFGDQVPADVVDTGTLVVADPNGTAVFNNPDRGRNWRENRTQGRLPPPVAIAFATPEIGWAFSQWGTCAGFKVDCTVHSQLLKTVDGGQSWTALRP